jgi:hypothetical protein
MRIRYVRWAIVANLLAMLGLAPTLSVSQSAHLIVIPTSLNGQSANFLLDTGAERSCLDSDFAARLGLEPAAEERILQVDAERTAGTLNIAELEVQSLRLRNLPVLSVDLTSMSLAAGVRIDGILGSDLLRHVKVSIDFYPGSAKFETDAALPDGASVVRLSPEHNLYSVAAKVQGLPVNFLLDTGASTSVISWPAWFSITSDWKPRAVLDGFRSSGSSGASLLALIPSISFGRASVRNLPLRVQSETSTGILAKGNVAGLMGTDLLQHFIVTLDLGNDRLFLKENPHYKPDPDRFSTIGIQFTKNEKGIVRIVAVWTPSPASAAGLKVGDRILKIDQLDAGSMSLDEFSRRIHGPAGKTVVLFVVSQNTKSSVRVATQCLLCPNTGVK